MSFKLSNRKVLLNKDELEHIRLLNKINLNSDYGTYDIKKIFKHKCQAKFCNTEKDVQYILVRNNRGKLVKEYYCQAHLRKKIFALECINLGNKINVEIKGL